MYSRNAQEISNFPKRYFMIKISFHNIERMILNSAAVDSIKRKQNWFYRINILLKDWLPDRITVHDTYFTFPLQVMTIFLSWKTIFSFRFLFSFSFPSFYELFSTTTVSRLVTGYTNIYRYIGYSYWMKIIINEGNQKETSGKPVQLIIEKRNMGFFKGLWKLPL